MKNIAILGDGLLGSQIHSQTGWDIISRNKNNFNITQPNDWHKTLIQSEHGVVFWPKYTTLINCIAHTDTYSTSKSNHWNVNLQGTKDLIDFCNKHKIKLVHISTDYIYSNSTNNATEEDPPVHCATWYGYTKLVADALVQLECLDYLILRTTHKPNPFPHKIAWKNQIGNFDYVDVISAQITNLINKNASGVFNIGTELKSMYSLAKQTNPNIKPENNSHPLAPVNVSMDTNKYKKFINENK